MVCQADKLQGLSSPFFFCGVGLDCDDAALPDEESQVTCSKDTPLYDKGPQTADNSIQIPATPLLHQTSDETNAGGMDLIEGIRSNIRRLTRHSVFAIEPPTEYPQEDSKQEIPMRNSQIGAQEAHLENQSADEEFGMGLGKILSHKNLAKRFRHSVKSLNLTDIEEERQVRLERCYDVYDPHERKVIVKKMESDLLDKFPGRQRASQVVEKIMEEPSFNIEPPAADADELLHISSGLASPRAMSNGRQVSVGLTSPGAISKDVSATMSPRNSDTAAKAPTTERSPALLPRVSNRRRMELVTNWALIVEKILKADVAEVSQLGSRLRDQEWMKKNLKETRSEIKTASHVRLRCLSIMRAAKSMAKRIATEQVDRLDSEWNDSSLLLKLLGKDGDISDTMTLLIKAACKIVASQPLLVEVDAPCKVFGDINGQFRDLLLHFGTYGCPSLEDSQSYIFNGNFTGSGTHQLETIAMLFAFKVVMPDKIWLLRGSNEGWSETGKIKQPCELKRACDMYFGTESGANARSSLTKVFDQLPVACLVSKRVLVAHGGIGDGCWELGELRNLRRPLIEGSVRGRNEELVRNLMWSRPVVDDVNGSPPGSPGRPPPFRTACVVDGAESRETRVTDFTWRMTATFCARNSLSLIVSSRFVKESGMGFDVAHENAVAQVLSARDCCARGHDGTALWIYPSKRGNVGGMLNVRPQVLRSVTKTQKDMLALKVSQRRRCSKDISPTQSPRGGRRNSSPTGSPPQSPRGNRRNSLDSGASPRLVQRRRSNDESPPPPSVSPKNVPSDASEQNSAHVVQLSADAKAQMKNTERTASPKNLSPRRSTHDDCPPRSTSPKNVSPVASERNRNFRKSIDSIATFKSNSLI